MLNWKPQGFRWNDRWGWKIYEKGIDYSCPLCKLVIYEGNDTSPQGISTGNLYFVRNQNQR